MDDHQQRGSRNMQGKASPRLELIPGGSPLPKGGGRIETKSLSGGC